MPKVTNGGMAPEGSTGEGDPWTPDNTLPDRSDQLLDVFGLEGDWKDAMTGVEAKLSSGGDEPPNPGTPREEAPAFGAAPAAEGAPAATPAPATPPAPAGASSLPQSTPAAIPAAVPAPAPATGTASEVQTLKAQLEALQQLMAAQGQSGGQPPVPSGTTPPATPASAPEPTIEELQDYRFAIPNDVLNAIESDDQQTRSNGLHHLVNSFAKVTHQRVIQHVEQLVRERLAQDRSAQQYSAQQAEMQRDYYSAFPDHNDPMTKMVVATEAQAMWAETPGLGWSKEARDALGTRVNIKLGRAAVPPTMQPQVPADQQPAPTNGAAPPPKAAAMTGASTKSGSPQESTGSEILTILSAF